MFCMLAALAFVMVSHIVQTTFTTISTKPTKSNATIAAGFPICTLNIIHNGTTGAPNGTSHSLVSAANPATLLLCSGADCSPTCSEFSLNSLAEDQCIKTNVQMLSVAVLQSAGGGLPFEVAIGTEDCRQLVVI